MRVIEDRRTAGWGRTAVAVLATVAAAAVVVACAGEPPAEEEPRAGQEAEPTPEQAAAPTGEPRVFFVEPQDGDTVRGSVEAVFGSENVEIGAVPEQVDTPREGIVHYHLGFDTECLPPDTEIPQADPWIHFGDGSDRIELEVPEPGKYRLTVQAGDDLHRTIEGLCETIDVTAVPAG